MNNKAILKEEIKQEVLQLKKILVKEIMELKQQLRNKDKELLELINDYNN